MWQLNHFATQHKLIHHKPTILYFKKNHRNFLKSWHLKAERRVWGVSKMGNLILSLLTRDQGKWEANTLHNYSSQTPRSDGEWVQNQSHNMKNREPDYFHQDHSCPSKAFSLHMPIKFLSYCHFLYQVSYQIVSCLPCKLTLPFYFGYDRDHCLFTKPMSFPPQPQCGCVPILHACGQGPCEPMWCKVSSGLTCKPLFSCVWCLPLFSNLTWLILRFYRMSGSQHEKNIM